MEEEYEEAYAHYAEAVSADPDNLDYLLKRATCAYSLGHYRKSLEDAKIALVKDDGCGRAYFRKGLALTALSEPELAVEAFKRGKAVDAGLKKWDNLIAQAEHEVRAEAVAVSEDSGVGLMGVHDQSIGVSSNEASSGIGSEALISMSAFTETPRTARGEYRREDAKAENFANLSQEQREARALEEKAKGNAAVEEEEFATAAFHYSTAIRLQETLASLYTNRAYALYKLGHYEDALKDARKSTVLQPNWAKGYYRAALIYAQRNDYAASRAVLAEGIKACEGQKDLEVALQLVDVFERAAKAGVEPSVVPFSASVLGTIQNNVTTLRSARFADLVTAVTMAVGEDQTKCIRQAFVDRRGGIVSIDSTSYDPSLQEKLRDGLICQVYIFVMATTKKDHPDYRKQKFFYKEASGATDQDGTTVNPLTRYQVDILDLTFAEIGQDAAPNPTIHDKL